MFKGEYYNGKRWNGVIYNYDGIKECEIKYGKGIIKEYNTKGELIFKGQYINGLRNGEGEEYYDSKNVIFKGNYLNGLRHGKGEEYYLNKNILFQGEYLNGRRWNGTIYKHNNKKKYEIKDGKGKIKD